MESTTHIKNVVRRVQNCSNPIQLREVYLKYQYLFTSPELIDAITFRVNTLMDMTGDQTQLSLYEQLMDEVDDCSIIDAKSYKLRSRNTIRLNFSVEAPFGDVFRNVVESLVVSVIEHCNKDKHLASKLLGVDFEDMELVSKNSSDIIRELKKVTRRVKQKVLAQDE